MNASLAAVYGFSAVEDMGIVGVAGTLKATRFDSL